MKALDLSSLRSKLPKKRAGRSPESIEDAMIGSMADDVSFLGMLEEAAHGLREKEVDLAFGVKIFVAEPRIPLVDINGMDLFDMIAKGAKVGADALIKEAGPSKAKEWALSVTPSSVSLAGHPDCAVIIAAVAFRIMAIQGWRLVAGNARSPAWVYPEYKFPISAVAAHASEMIQANMLEGA